MICPAIPTPKHRLHTAMLRTKTAFTTALVITLVAIIAGTGLAEPTYATDTATDTATATETATAQKDTATATTKRPKVKIETTKGTIIVEVFTDKAPLSATNFLKLVDEGFYNGLIFHRVVANFVVQTGGYNAELNYKTPPATVPNESSNGLENTRGTIAMARQTDPDSADAQFFINMRDNPHLNPVGDRPGYSVFGQVLAGMDAAERIELSDTNIQAGMAGVPEHPIEIIAVSRLP